MADGLAILNPNPRRLPGPDLLHTLVSGSAYDDRVAVDFLSSSGSIERVTYRQLHSRANVLARRLRVAKHNDLQTQSNTSFIVPIFIPQCPELYIAELAVLKADGAFCPISTDVPEERLRFILKDVNAHVLLTTTQLRSSLPNIHGLHVLLVDNLDEDLQDAQQHASIASSNTAYVMYTSGSTGQPKGVLVSHSAATQALLAHDRHIPSFRRFLQFASPTFDVSVFEIFFPLFRGCTIVSGERRLMLNDLPLFINRMNIDAAELTPSVASSLLRDRGSVPNLQCLLTIGEMLRQDVIQKFAATEDDAGILHGMYGPTEATIHCTLQTSFSIAMPATSIGKPLDTVSAFVLRPLQAGESPTEQFDILAVGEEGELAFGGHQLANGYLNRPNETEAAFVLHPEHGLLYRTGDLGSITASGTLECLGRISHGQVKLRGQRLELGEVEYAASRTYGVSSVVADIIDNALVTFYVCDTAVSELEVRQTCRKWLPAFMVPSEAVRLDRFPYLESGKVDRKALREIYTSRRSRPQPEGTGPTTSSLVAQIVGESLDTIVSDDTSIASLGVDSLSAIRIASQLQRHGFPQIDATTLLDTPTVGALQILLESRQVQASDVLQNGELERSEQLRKAVLKHSAIAKRMEEVDEVLVPTAVQLSMLAETAKNNQAYCNWVEFSVRGQCPDPVHHALLQLAQHHPLLRAGFLALSEFDPNYGLIVWKRLTASQIRITVSFDRDFQITQPHDLLTPCHFQLLPTSDGIRVLLQIHHALYDQWSIDVLKADLTTLLRGASLPERPSFRSISDYQHANRARAFSDESLEYWQATLTDSTTTAFPLLDAKRTTKKLQRSTWTVVLPDLYSTRHAARKLDVGLHVLFQAAYSYLLSCLVGSTDITYGMVFSGRHLPIAGIEDVFGPCLTTLPLRIDVSNVRTFSDLLRVIKRRNLDLQKHSLTPLSAIQQARSHDGGNRLFDTLIVWQETSLESCGGQGLVTEIDSADHHEFNLVLEIQPTDDSILAKVTYEQALLTLDQVGLLLQQITAIVQQILHEPDTLITDLAESLPRELLSISNIPTSPCSDHCDLLDSLDRHAKSVSTSPAIAFAKNIVGDYAHEETLSFADLRLRSGRMARLVRSSGVRPDDLVCICMEKSIDMYVAILATFIAGAGYIPLMPDTPRSRLQAILKQAGVKLCLCDAETTPILQSLASCLVVDITAQDLSSYEINGARIAALGHHVAYVVFTSGSTGEPKGVTVTRDNLLGNLQALKELYNTKPGDRLLQSCSQAFDVSVFEIFFSFYTGMCLCSAKHSELFFDFEASIRAFRITHLSLTPTVAALVDPKNVPTVRFLVTAGEGVTDLVHRRWADRGLHQGYGPSETTNICTVNMDVSSSDVINNIGKAFRNTSAFVVASASDFQILPAGSFGEFAFGGEQVFRGYLNRDDLNAKQIIEHPEFGRVYRSGDMGRILSDGTLLISGRIDSQVKIRGNRIELGEITSILLGDTAIRDAAVIVVGHKAAEQSLAAFVVTTDVESAQLVRPELVMLSSERIAQLFARLINSLPHYMVPDSIVPITALPLTSQGKLDRRYLSSLLEGLTPEIRRALSRGADDVDDNSDWSDTEREVSDTLRETLGIPNVNFGRNQSFFSMGLNSLNAMPFARKLSQRLEIRVDVPTVLRSFTISRLARALNSNATYSNGHRDPIAEELLTSVLVNGIRASNTATDEIESILPCTPLQLAMLSTGSSSSASYCNSMSFTVNGDVDRLRQSWAHMVFRHSILRTRFIESSDREHPFVQVVLKQVLLPWEEVDKQSTKTKPESRKHPLKALRVNASRPFCIESASSPQGNILTLHVHHAIYDGICIGRLLEEVELAYNGNELPPAPSFLSFLIEMKAQSGSEALEFWSKRMAGYEPKPFPLASPPVSKAESQIETTLFVSPDDVASFSKRYAFTPLAVFQAALAKVLLNAQSTHDLCFGNVVSGRTVPIDGIEDLVAPCFNTIPMRITISQGMTNLELARYLNNENTSMLPYQLTPLRRVQGFSRSPSTRLFDCLLIFQPEARRLDPGIWSLESEAGAMGIPLVFEVVPTAGAYKLLLHFQQAYVGPAQARHLALAFDAALSSCIDYPDSQCQHLGEASDTHLIAGRLQSNHVHEDVDSESPTQINESWIAEEAAVRKAFASLANVREDKIQKGTSMYRLGLDSLNAPQIAHHLRSLGYQVDVADVMESPTPSTLGAVIRARSDTHTSPTSVIDLDAFDRQWRPTVQALSRLDDDDLQAVRPCTSVQCGMLSQTLFSEGKLYINHVTYAIPATVSVADLRNAWSLVVEGHQTLRTSLYQVEDCPYPFVMAIRSSRVSDVPFLELSNEMSLDDIESQSRGKILASRLAQAWQIAVQNRAESRVMVLSLHHALYDAQSLSTILADLGAVLSGSVLRSPPDIDPILFSTLTAETDQDGKAESYWKGPLNNFNFSKFPDLAPTVTKHIVVRSERLQCSLFTSSLEQFCKDHDVSMQVLGQATWAKLLAAYTGEENVTFGTVLSNRPADCDAQAVFPCVMTIPVPCSTSGLGTDLLRQMLDFNASARKHCGISLSTIQRIAGRTSQPLFDTVFVYQKLDLEQSDFDWRLVRETSSVEYAVCLELEASGGNVMNMTLTFNTGLIPKEHASLMLRQYDQLLSGFVTGNVSAVDNNNGIWSMLPALHPRLPSELQLLHQRLERGASDHPQRPALQFVYGEHVDKTWSKTWTYEELNSIGNQVAHMIQRAGIPSGSIIAVCMDKCPEASFAFVGILKAGCAFLAIDPALPESRLSFILEDSNARLLFGDKRPPPASLPAAIKYIDLIEGTFECLPKCAVSKAEVVSPDATCYCLYTSGTTGTPKGCEITHDNVVQAMLSFERLFAGRWDESSRWLQFASYWFDVSVLEQFWTWGVGMTVVGASRDLVLDDLPRFIRDFGITHIDLTPSLARLVHPDDVPSLWNGVFITGGEALKQEIIDLWGPKHTICNGYGPTEATIGVTMNTFIGSDAKPSNIGRQFDNVGTFVLQPGSQDVVMRGAVGELCISGPLVGKAYLNRDDLTAKHFPFLKDYGERVYRTGDLVRMLADGSFSFVGRQDTQTKLRGQRLEISEIDGVIQRSTNEMHNVVSMIVKSDGDAKEMLVSFITLATAGPSPRPVILSSTTAQGVVRKARNACIRSLPTYMVPTHILPISRQPLTVNNKLDTKEMVALFKSVSVKDLQAFQDGPDANQSLNDSEERIRSVLARLLSVTAEDIAKSANVFSLGLSSISAISFATHLKKAGFSAASPALVMRNPTVELLGQALAMDSDSAQQPLSSRQICLHISASTHRLLHRAVSTLSMLPHLVEAIIPCAPLQQGMIVDSMRGNSAAYFNEFRYSIPNVDVEKLKSAWQTLVDGLQILRACFLGTDEGHVQVILRHRQVDFIEHGESTKAHEAFLRRQKQEWVAQNAAELVCPLQIHAFRHRSDQSMVIFIHHALYDGISFDLMIEKLFEAYSSGRPDDFGAPFTTAAYHGPLQAVPNAEAFWRDRFKDVHNPPTHAAQDTQEGESHLLDFSLGAADRMEATRRQLGISHQALLQSCFEIALHQLQPSTRIYGLVVSGRSISLEEADEVVGPMFNTLPQPLIVHAGTTFDKHSERCHGINVETIPFQHSALRDVRRWCGQNTGARMFDAIFIFQHKEAQQLSRSRELFTPIPTFPRADYPFECEMELTRDGMLDVTLLAQSRYYDQESLARLRELLVMAFDSICSRPSDLVSDVFELTPTDTGEKNGIRINGHSNHVNGKQQFHWTDNANVIRGILAELSGIDPAQIDQHTSIFTLGLDSIDAAKLVSRLKKAGLSISTSKLLQAQTVAAITKNVKAVHEAVNGKTHGLLQTVSRQLAEAIESPEIGFMEKILPATPNQEALLADMVRTELREYFSHDVLRVAKSTELERLKRAWQSVVDATPILRTSFVEVTDPSVSNVFAQMVHPKIELPFEQYHAQELQDLEHILDEIRNDVHKNFRSTPPLRLTIVTVQSETYLVLSMVHAQYDGYSLAMLHEDVRSAYHGQLATRPSYEAVIEQSLKAASEGTEYWTDLISGAQTRPFPQKADLTKASTTHRHEIICTVPLRDIHKFCRKQAVSMQALTETCWALTLAHFTQSLDVLFGVVLACRDSEDAERTMFPTMSTVIMRASLHGSRAQMLQYVQSIISERSTYQRTPLRTVQANVGDLIGTGQLFDTLFIHQRRPVRKSETPALCESIGGRSDVEYLVAVETEPLGDALILRAACKDNGLDASGTAALLEHLDGVVRSVVTASTMSTVELEGSRVSVCGGEAFHLHQTRATAAVEQDPAPISDSASDVPQSHLLEVIVKTLAEVSRTASEDIAANTTIESIGIDSVSAIKVATLLRRQSVDLSVSNIIRAKTPARMAAIASTKSGQPREKTSPGNDSLSASISRYPPADLAKRLNVKISNIERVLPATAGQMYMLSMWLKTRGTLFYATFEHQLNFSLSLGQIEKAWNVLLDRHPILRTALVATVDEQMPVLQVVLHDVKANILSGRPKTNGTTTTQAMVSLTATKNDEGYLLHLRIHHALYDAVSIPLIMEDFDSLLSRSSKARPKVDFADFISLSIGSEATNVQQTFWTRYLRNSNPIQLQQPASDLALPRIEIFKPGLFAEIAALESLARKERVSTQAILFAAYATMYASLAAAKSEEKNINGCADIVLGIYLSNRSHLADLDTLPAPTLNLVPLLVRRVGETSLIEMAKQIHADLTDISTASNSAVSLGRIREWTGIKIDTFVNFLRLPGREEDSKDAGHGLLVQTLDERRSKDRHEVIEHSGAEFEVPIALRDLRVDAAYQHSIDVEMMVQDGKLSVGIFSPEVMVGLEEAEEGLLKLKSILDGLTSGTSK